MPTNLSAATTSQSMASWAYQLESFFQRCLSDDWYLPASNFHIQKVITKCANQCKLRIYKYLTPRISWKFLSGILIASPYRSKDLFWEKRCLLPRGKPFLMYFSSFQQNVGTEILIASCGKIRKGKDRKIIFAYFC